MATIDDAATVLEQFTHDVANLPAEIAHLLEEIKAKDEIIMQCKDHITSRDAALQRHVKQNGSHVKHPKEEIFTKAITDSFDRMEALQKEKIALSEKAMVVLERQIKRFDVKLRDLQATDQFPRDPSLPSLLHPSAGNAVPPLSGVSTPLQSMSVNSAQGGTNVANAAIARLAGTARTASGTASPNPLLVQSHLNVPAAGRSPRETSADASKRRRLNASLGSLPTASSNLRQTSTGPAATPKPGTPGPTSRAGSAQPSKPAQARKAPGQKKGSLPSTSATSAAGRKRLRTSIMPSKKGDRRRQLAGRSGRGSPSASPTPSDSHASVSPTPSAQPSEAGTKARGAVKQKVEPTSDDEDVTQVEAGEEDDTEVYCSCQRTSFGDMIGCDNLDCKYQWFHWSCVGLKETPEGEWLCPFCKKLPKDKIRKEED
ncbi:hypothetical protein BDZ85DRAFT_294682 [Elsinoe ampelina]|uniref:Chromatin modification-related protein n=1 Tax=Elsinoe ampelina TaxID=302913 RepID=A0A6A6GGM3_9PEZI|nr:hypothetical protein BDZ85DRAFT_294682 [Elsinoe ampelina]